MTGLETEELLLLRTEAEGWFPDVLNISRVTTVDDPFSGSSDDVETLWASGIPCSIESGAALEQTAVIAGKVQGVQIFAVTVPTATDIRVTDKLTITSRNNKELRVQAVMAPESWEIERRVIATELGEP